MGLPRVVRVRVHMAAWAAGAVGPAGLFLTLSITVLLKTGADGTRGLASAC